MVSKIQAFVTLVLFQVLVFTKAQDTSVSDLCASQREVIIANEALIAATPERECIINEGKDSCTVDFEPVSDNFKEACYAAGGIFYVVDLLWDCSSVGGISLDADFTYLNFPSCHGINCTANELEELFETTLYAMAEDELQQQGFVCDVSDKNEMLVPQSSGTFFSFSIVAFLGVFAIVMIV